MRRAKIGATILHAAIGVAVIASSLWPVGAQVRAQDYFGPAISVTKTVSPDTIHAGDTVTYTIVVTNTGDVALMVSVTDDVLGAIVSDVFLGVGASATYTVTDNPTQDVTNTVTATGTSYIGDVVPEPGGGLVIASDTAFVDVLNPAIAVTKTVSPGVISVGQTATYTIVVANTGDAHLTVDVEDDVLGTIASDLSLDAGASVTYTIADSPSGDVTNTVTATGVDDIGGVVSDSATASLHVLPAVSVAYIYASDAASADSFKSLLEGSGYPTTLVTLADVATTDLSAYDLLIVGSDTGYDYDWGDPEAVAAVQGASRPIIGLGFGGSTLFQQLELSINWGNGWIGSENSLYVGDPTPAIYDSPNPIAIPEDRTVRLYTSSSHIGEYAPLLPDHVDLLGRETGDVNHYPLVREGQSLLWGFTASPESMTETGRRLFLNAVVYMAGLPAAAQPDLVITDAWSEGSHVLYQVRNIGDVVAPGGHTTALLVNGVQQASDVVDADLQPGERLTRSFAYDWTSTSTQDTIVVWADYGDDVAESDETNNRREETWKQDTTPPVLTNVSVIFVSEDSALIRWETDEPSDSEVQYSSAAGRATPDVVEDDTLVTSHRITLDALAPATTYHFVAMSEDPSRNRGFSRDTTFETLRQPDTADPLVTLSTLDTWQYVTTISADASDDTGVEKVEFLLDGTLIFTDYSAPYMVNLDASQYANGQYDLATRVTDLSGKSSEDTAPVSVANLKDASVPVVNITAPARDAHVSGKITVSASLSDDIGVWKALLAVDAWSKGDKTWPSPRPKNASVQFTLDTTKLDNGRHRIAVIGYDGDWKSGLDTVDVWVKNVPPPPPPKLTVAKHKATRHGNYFTVSLTVKNVGGDQAKDIVIKDNLLLLQPIGRNTAVARYSPDLVASAKSSDMVITSHVSIPPGQSRTYTFDAVPILPYPSGPVPMIGNYVDLKWSSPSQSGFTDYVQAPALKTTAGKLIVNAHSSALKSSDYLIVTSPNNLLSYNPASDVNDLLSSMAELARYRNGVLGYLDVPSSFVRSYQAHDGFAVGDVGGDTKHEIVIGDAQNDRIYVYQVTRRGFTYGGSAQFEIVWNTYAQFKAGLNQQGFEPGDRLAVGDLPGGTKSEIVMADASANTVLIYDGKGTLLSKFSVNLEPYDGLAVGDVTGDHKDEVVIADRSANKIYTYNYWGVKLTEFSKDYEAHDGIAAGDVWGNDKDEVIIGDRSANKVYTFSAGGSPRGSFSQTFDQGDGLAAGNAQWSWQNDKDEIVMGDADQNWVTIRKMDGTLLKSFSRDYESFDGLAVGKIVPGSNNDEVLVADRSENSIDIHDAARQGNKHLLRDLIKAGVKWGSLWTSSLYGTGVWSSKLKSDWVTKGYLLIVGETEIVPAWGDKKVGTAYTTRGNVELRTDAADYPYASTYGEETKPELSIGRIVGNSAKELRKPIEASVNVAKGTTGYGFDRSTALVVSGFAKGLGGGADDINFKKEADAAAKTLQGKNINTFTMHTPGYTLKDSSGAIDKKATEQAIENAFFGNISGIDVLFLTGHGNSNSWDVIGADDVLKQLMPFGSVNPFVFASSCATGSYQVGLSLAETFLSRGAAVYLGATKWGLGTHQWISNLLYSKWDTGESVALAVKQVNRSIGDYKFYNSSTGQYTTSPNKYERYWTAIYHVFGDAKYGAQGPAAAAVSSQSSPLSAAPPSSVAIQVPGYQTEQVNGQDFVTIPGGHVVALPGTPLVPYYQVSYDYPSGYQIQDVTLASRSEPVTATGLNIPWEVIAIGADGTSLPPVPEPFASLEWWPDQLFSWNVFEGPDTATLVISVFPFDYNPLTTDVKFYEDYQFNVSYTSPDVEITRLATDRSIYALGEAVAVDVEFHDGVQGDMPPAAKDIVVSTVVRSEATGEVVGGLPLRTLHGFTGSGAYSAAWDSSGFEGGYYTVEVELRDTQGVLLDTEVQGFSLGTSQVEITGLTATPEVFDIGNSVDLSLGYSNIGTTTVSGSAVIQVQDEDGQTVASFVQDFTDLAPSQSATFGAAWDTSGAEPGSYQAVGYVLYGGVVAGPIVVSMQSNTPHADAGPDQTVERSSLEGGETTLDGSASYDPDGDALSYEWSWPGGAASGVASVVVLPMGLTTVALTVSDGQLSDSDTVDIRVVDTTPPEIAVEPPGAAGGLAGEVVFTADASDLSGVDGVYFWIRQANGAEGEPIGYEAVPGTLASGSPEAGAWTYAFDTAQLLDGSYILLAKAVDSYGNEAWSEVVPFEVRNWTVEERLPKSKKNRAGRTMPIKFSLRMDERADPAEPFVYREDLEVRVYDAADPGTILQASTYGDGSRSYRIDTQDELYITNFKTGRAPARYVVQIWLLANDFLLGSFTFSTDR